MSGTNSPRFRYLGDWLIWRSTGVLGDFQMPTCVSIISNEGVRDGWKWNIGTVDVERILARYKEHVTSWNAGVDAIRNELRAFAYAIGWNHEMIFQMFDSSPSRRHDIEYF
jgi:hypothetical protein